MTRRHWLSVGVVAVFAAGVGAGLLVRGDRPAALLEPDVELGASVPLTALPRPAGDTPSPIPFAPSNAHGERTWFPPGQALPVDLHPPEYALHVQAVEDAGERGASKGDGPQLHPPDAPSLPSPDLSRPFGPALPRRTAENDPQMAPGKLVPPPGAPRASSAAADRLEAVLKALVAQELPEATAQEREVWLEKIRGMDPASARYLLELRRRVGSAAEEAMRKPGAPRPLEADVAHRPSHLPPPAWPKPIEEADPQRDTEIDSLPPEPEMADPLADESVITRPLTAAMSAVRQARGIVVHNLANARTDGFKKVTYEFAETGYLRISRRQEFGPDASFGEGAEVRTSVDFSQGPIRRTGRPLDIAIDGEGWLQVQLGEEIGYTRCGRLHATRNGELAIRANGRAFLIEPTVVVPPDATKITISAEGQVLVEQWGQDEPTAIGQLQLARFAGDFSLAPCGWGLFKQQNGAEPVVSKPGEAGCGKLSQGHLEGSNVDIKAEIDELRQLHEMSQALVEAVRLMQDDSDSREDEPDAFRASNEGEQGRCCGLQSCENGPCCRRGSAVEGNSRCGERCCGERCRGEHGCEDAECPLGECPADEADRP